jgi:hypothetical protein
MITKTKQLQSLPEGVLDYSMGYELESTHVQE